MKWTPMVSAVAGCIVACADADEPRVITTGSDLFRDPAHVEDRTNAELVIDGVATRVRGSVIVEVFDPSHPRVSITVGNRITVFVPIPAFNSFVQGATISDDSSVGMAVQLFTDEGSFVGDLVLSRERPRSMSGTFTQVLTNTPSGAQLGGDGEHHVTLTFDAGGSACARVVDSTYTPDPDFTSEACAGALAQLIANDFIP